MMGTNHNELPNELERSLQGKSPEEMARIRRIWAALGHLEPSALPDTETGLADLMNELPHVHKLPNIAEDRPPNRRSTLRLVVRSLATAAVLVFVATAVLWMQPMTIEVPAGAQQAVTLPDGSTVELNSASSIRFQRRFERFPLMASNERHVYLEGEAFFSVEQDGRPFIVETFNAQVEVLGTRYHVRARSNETALQTVVALEEGKVRVSHLNTDVSPALLDSPGDRVVVGEGLDQAEQEESLLRRQTVWRQEGFAATDDPLFMVLMEIERRYNVRIQMTRDVDALKAVNLIYQNPVSLETILNDLCISIGCTYREASRGYVIDTQPATTDAI